MVILTQEERDKFATWCRQEAAADQALAEGAAKLGVEMLAKHKRAEAVAKLVVAKVLSSIDTQVLTDG